MKLLTDARCDSATPSDSPLGEPADSAAPVTGGPRLLSFWLARHPPGWASQHPAATADPIALATKAQGLAIAFADWLSLPREERWDTFTLQALSAALFNRYRVEVKRGARRLPPISVSLLQLSWPPGSQAIQHQVAELQQLLAAPFAIFKAIRVAVDAEVFPTGQELRLAEETIVAAREELKNIALRLGAALEQYAAENGGDGDVLGNAHSKTNGPAVESVVP